MTNDSGNSGNDLIAHVDITEK